MSCYDYALFIHIINVQIYSSDVAESGTDCYTILGAVGLCDRGVPHRTGCITLRILKFLTSLLDMCLIEYHTLWMRNRKAKWPKIFGKVSKSSKFVFFGTSPLVSITFLRLGSSKSVYLVFHLFSLINPDHAQKKIRLKISQDYSHIPGGPELVLQLLPGGLALGHPAGLGPVTVSENNRSR